MAGGWWTDGLTCRHARQAALISEPAPACKPACRFAAAPFRSCCCCKTWSQTAACHWPPSTRVQPSRRACRDVACRVPCPSAVKWCTSRRSAPSPTAAACWSLLRAPPAACGAPQVGGTPREGKASTACLWIGTNVRHCGSLLECRDCQLQLHFPLWLTLPASSHFDHTMQAWASGACAPRTLGSGRGMS